jgi:lipoate---protein ligase
VTWTSLWHPGIRGDLGLAVDEAALGWVAASSRADIGVLHLYRFHPAAVVIGYHQDPRSEADLAACAARGVEVHRRLTGGGSILMGPGQLGLALALPRAAVSTAGGFGPVFEALSGGIIGALRRHGVESVLRPKNDLAVDGRKICGVGAYTDAAGMLLFHASTLVDVDFDLMLEVLRIPDAKHRDKFVAHAREGMTTLREQAGHDVSVEDFAADVEDGYRRALGVRIERGTLDPVRWEDVERLAAPGRSSPRWRARPAAAWWWCAAGRRRAGCASCSSAATSSPSAAWSSASRPRSAAPPPPTPASGWRRPCPRTTSGW